MRLYSYGKHLFIEENATGIQKTGARGTYSQKNDVSLQPEK